MDSSDIYIPRSVRSTLYVALIVGSPIIGYLSVQGTIGANEVALWSALTTAIAVIARLNLTPKSAEADKLEEAAEDAKTDQVIKG